MKLLLSAAADEARLGSTRDRQLPNTKATTTIIVDIFAVGKVKQQQQKYLSVSLEFASILMLISISAAQEVELCCGHRKLHKACWNKIYKIKSIKLKMLRF